MQRAVGFGLFVTTALWASVASADSVKGTVSDSANYVLDTGMVCEPIARAVAPTTKLTADPKCTVLKDKVVTVPTTVLRGSSAAYRASVRGRLLSITTQTGDAVLTWEGMDVLSSVKSLELSQSRAVLIVTVVMTRGGRDVERVLGFVVAETAPATTKQEPTASNSPSTTAVTATSSPALDAALKKARTSKGKTESAAWDAVLGLSPGHSEALFAKARIAAEAKNTDLTVAHLGALASNGRSDAIEYLVEARTHKSFDGMRGVATFRGAIGLDKPPTTMYEKLMGHGGTWEQAGTSCDKAEVALNLYRSRKFDLKVTTRCSGSVDNIKFKGTWNGDTTQLTLSLGKTSEEQVVCNTGSMGGETSLTCAMDEDLSFTLLPIRR